MMNTLQIGNEKDPRMVTDLSQSLAGTFTLYLKTLGYHWNVEGHNFYGLHKMFEEQYRNLQEASDILAERIRQVGGYVPASYSEYARLAKISLDPDVPVAVDMVTNLAADHMQIVEDLKIVRERADRKGDHATVALLEERMLQHEKMAWMLRSTAVEYMPRKKAA